MAKSVAIRFGTEGKAAVKNDFAEVGAAGDEAAKRLKAAFDRASADAEKAQERATRAMAKIAAIAPQTAAQMRINDATGVGGNLGEGSAKISAMAMRELIAEQEKMERQAESLRRAIDPLYAAQARHNEEVREASRLLEAGVIDQQTYARAALSSKEALETAAMAEQRRNAAMAQGVAMSRQAAAGYQNLSFQIGDSIQSLAFGTSPFIVFGQQANQFIGALQQINEGSQETATGIGALGGAAQSTTRSSVGLSTAIGAVRGAHQQALPSIAAVAGAAALEGEAMAAATGASAANTGAVNRNAAAHGAAVAPIGAATAATAAHTGATAANAVATNAAAGAKARMVAFLAGPWGAGVIGAVTVLGLLSTKLLDTKDATGGASKALDVKRASADDLREALAKLDEQTRSSLRTSQESEAQAYAEAKAIALRAIELQKEARERLRAGLAAQQGVEDNFVPGEDNAVRAEAARRLILIRNELLQLDKDIAAAEAAQRRDYLPLQNRRVAESLDPAKRAAGELERTQVRLRQEVERGTRSWASYREELAKAEKAKDAAVKAAQDAERREGRPARYGREIAADNREDLLRAAQRFGGLSERDATGNAALRDLFKQASINVDPKMVAWCAAFVNAVLATEGLPGTGSLSARSFLGYGKATDTPEKGDIVVLRRGQNPASGHVGFFAGFDPRGNVRVTGGNQSDRVGTDTFSKNDVLGFRRAPSIADAAADAEKTAADAAADRAKAYADMLGSAQEASAELADQLRVGELRAAGLEREADTAETLARLFAEHGTLLGAGTAEARATWEALEGQTRALIAQKGHQDDLAKLRADAKKNADEFVEGETKRFAGVGEQIAKEESERKAMVRDVADFYRDAMRTVGKSIIRDFKDSALDMIAQVAAQWTVAMLSGQQASLPGILGQLNAQAGGNPLASLLGSLFGGGGSAGGSGGPPVFGGGNQGQPGGVLSFGFGGPSAMGGGQAAGALGAIGGAVPYVAAGLAVNSLVSDLLGNDQVKGGKILGIISPFLTAAFGSALRGSATLGVDEFGQLGVGSTRGNSKSRQASASSAIDAVSEALNRIAEGLGGAVTGTPSVSLGMRKKDWRLDTTGRGITKTKNGAIDFGQDQEAAVRAAVADALADGVIGGISDAQRRILASGQPLEKALEKASLIGDIPKRLGAWLDPVGAAIDELNERWRETEAALKEGGASAAEMADAQKLYRMELEETKARTREASADLKDFLKGIAFGSGSPFSLRDQEAKARAELQPMLDMIGRGERIDQAKYTEAAQSFLDIERQLYGSTGRYFAELDRIQAATGKAIADIDNAKPIRTVQDPFTERTAKAAEAGAAISDQMNERLAVIEGHLARIVGVSGGSGFAGGGRGFMLSAPQP